MPFLHDLVFAASVFHELSERDQEFAREVQAAGCPFCGGVLDRADYGRKGRGAPAEVDDSELVRRSFCCRREGCRRRVTPPSCLFLGRRVYLAPVVVLVSALAVGATHRESNAAGAVYKAAPRTVGRWRRWWFRLLPLTAFWLAAKGAFASAIEEPRLPLSLLEIFSGWCSTRSLVLALVWLSALTRPIVEKHAM